MKGDATARAEQTIALLWRHRAETPRRRGPRPGRSLDELIRGGIEIADADGLGALTVRRLAERVGLSRMAVYGYVADLEQLIELMIDTVHAELLQAAERFPYRAGAVRFGDPRTTWRDGAEAVADANLALIGRHRWLVARPNDRPVLGPHSTAKYDAELATFEGLGLTDVEIDLALWQLLNHVRIAAADLETTDRGETDRAETDRGETDRAETGRGEGSSQSGADWWQVSAGAAARWITADEFPRAVRVGAAAGEAQGSAYDPDASYRFGLERILDGLQALVDARGDGGG